MINLRVYISGTLPHRTKIVVAGNHELGFDPIEVDFSSLFQTIKPFFNSRRSKCAIYRTLVRALKMATNCSPTHNIYRKIHSLYEDNNFYEWKIFRPLFFIFIHCSTHFYAKNLNHR